MRAGVARQNRHAEAAVAPSQTRSTAAEQIPCRARRERGSRRAEQLEKPHPRVSFQPGVCATESKTAMGHGRWQLSV